MQSLLEMFAMGVQDVEEFQGRLQQELGGLEVRCSCLFAARSEKRGEPCFIHVTLESAWHTQAANVHAILESGSAAAGVAERLKHAAGLLDDLEQNLSIFDIKLRHMREDIAAIEAHNNSLELQARNNGKLLAKLESAPCLPNRTT